MRGCVLWGVLGGGCGEKVLYCFFVREKVLYRFLIQIQYGEKILVPILGCAIFSGGITVIKPEDGVWVSEVNRKASVTPKPSVRATGVPDTTGGHTVVVFNERTQ